MSEKDAIEAVLTNEHVSDFVREGNLDAVRAEAAKWYHEAKPSFEFDAYLTALIERVEAEWRRQRDLAPDKPSESSETTEEVLKRLINPHDGEG